MMFSMDTSCEVCSQTENIFQLEAKLPGDQGIHRTPPMCPEHRQLARQTLVNLGVPENDIVVLT